MNAIEELLGADLMEHRIRHTQVRSGYITLFTSCLHYTLYIITKNIVLYFCVAKNTAHKWYMRYNVFIFFSVRSA